ncbi:HAD family hydrolase [Saccharopolyspora cebuensis]|uniref:HAD family hydrolase n=1 Tax=Saccharopolyspora cebuensis TaxID=418759 RepID=A0ABV4CI72_9PSEU
MSGRAQDAIVFCDFDATFWDHREPDRTVADIERLDLLIKAWPGRLLFGWVTGSSVAGALDLVRGAGLDFLPDFVSGDLGTDLRFREAGALVADRQWRHRLGTSGFTHRSVAEIVATFEAARGIRLVPQQPEFPAFKCGYYLPPEGADAANHLVELAAGKGVAVNLNRCNPDAGDPPGFFDVDFVPVGTGKAETVTYVLAGLDRATESFGFGDSGNDLAMLHNVDFPWLVANATEEAKRAGFPVTHRSCLGGVLDVLEGSLAREEETP